MSSKDQARQSVPLKYGAVVFPAFQALDLFGPLDVLNMLSLSHKLDLCIIAASLDPVSTQVTLPELNTKGSNFSQSIIPTHTFDNPPPLDVLLVPGGYGVRADTILPVIAFINKVYPSLQYLITVCSGSGIAARAGVLDGRRATTNKAAWARTVVFGPKVDWVTHARWVKDGNIWTAAGVSAGIDTVLAYIGEVYGEDVADKVSDGIEYERHKDSSWDPFADLNGLKQN